MNVLVLRWYEHFACVQKLFLPSRCRMRRRRVKIRCCWRSFDHVSGGFVVNEVRRVALKKLSLPSATNLTRDLRLWLLDDRVSFMDVEIHTVSSSHTVAVSMRSLPLPACWLVCAAVLWPVCIDYWSERLADRLSCVSVTDRCTVCSRWSKVFIYKLKKNLMKCGFKRGNTPDDIIIPPHMMWSHRPSVRRIVSS